MYEECIETLLEKGWVRDVFSKVKSKGKALLTHLDLSYVNTLYDERKTSNRGRPPEYSPEMKLRSILYCLASNVKKIRPMARKLRETLAWLICQFTKSSPSAPTLSRFLCFLAGIIEEVFYHLSVFAARLGIYSTVFLADTTSIEVSEDDPDGKWNYDATKQEWYYGYGLMVIVDWKTHLPAAALFTNGKHVGDTEIQEGLRRMYRVTSPTVFIGDGEFDTKNTHTTLLDHRTLPVIRYNPRNSKTPVSFQFRVEEFVSKRTHGKVHLDAKQLRRDYRKRIEVEHSISTMKSLGLEQPYAVGYDAVKTHTFLMLIYRLAIGIYRYVEQPNANLREVKIEL